MLDIKGFMKRNNFSVVITYFHILSVVGLNSGLCAAEKGFYLLSHAPSPSCFIFLEVSLAWSWIYFFLLSAFSLAGITYT
jgi:hypothetical protein